MNVSSGESSSPSSESHDSGSSKSFTDDEAVAASAPIQHIELDHEKQRRAPQNTDDNIEMVYIRDVLLAQHPFLSDVEKAVGRLTESSNADMLNAEALSGLLDPDRILLEALRTLSDDPSMRKLQASLEVEATMINQETAAYQTIHTTPFRRMAEAKASSSKPCSSRDIPPGSSEQDYCPVKPKRKKSCISAAAHKSACNRVVKKREKTPPESQRLLKDWLFTHSHHPYPTDAEKEHLCCATALSLQQLNNWFINARRRILPNYMQEQQKSPQSLQ